MGKETLSCRPLINRNMYPRKAGCNIYKRKHGKSKLFTSFPPLLMEVKSQQEFRARRDEIGEMRTGLSPVDPKSVPGIEPAPVQEV